MASLRVSVRGELWREVKCVVHFGKGSEETLKGERINCRHLWFRTIILYIENNPFVTVHFLLITFFSTGEDWALFSTMDMVPADHSEQLRIVRLEIILEWFRTAFPALEEKIGWLKENVKSLSERNKDLVRQIETKDCEIARLSEILKKITAKNVMLKEQVAEVKSVDSKNPETASGRLDEITRRDVEISTLKNQVVNLTRENERLGKEVTCLKEVNDGLRSDLDGKWGVIYQC